ncbi:hypothetical protein Nepgr_027739 [Nepenthes gracilis]|uniref:Uncharacterized protein n=1 Tax=Nepenthes gracilis TaxID=150966 RepID=A0AAD3TBX4_NEPGR|nr:hypothetical protein Nepgr_027739 [Nepenthes gracilis]
MNFSAPIGSRTAIPLATKRKQPKTDHDSRSAAEFQNRNKASNRDRQLMQSEATAIESGIWDAIRDRQFILKPKPAHETRSADGRNETGIDSIPAKPRNRMHSLGGSIHVSIDFIPAEPSAKRHAQLEITTVVSHPGVPTRQMD